MLCGEVTNLKLESRQAINGISWCKLYQKCVDVFQLPQIIIQKRNLNWIIKNPVDIEGGTKGGTEKYRMGKIENKNIANF